MKQSYEILRDKSITVKNEVEDGANTSNRIGGLIEDIVDTVDDSIKNVSKSCSNNTTNIEKITPIVLTEKEYEDLENPNPNRIYYITEEE